MQAAELPAAQAPDAHPVDTRQADPRPVDTHQADPRPVEPRAGEPRPSEPSAAETRPAVAAAPGPTPAATQPRPVEAAAPPQRTPVAPMGVPVAANRGPAPRPSGPDRGTPCTAPQLRRFIKSRPYVPMHELRRRFAIETEDDDVNPIDLDPGRVFVGLPAREGQLLGELLRAGEVGYELSLDPRTPVVIGVYPMRPVPRP